MGWGKEVGRGRDRHLVAVARSNCVGLLFREREGVKEVKIKDTLRSSEPRTESICF